MPQFLYQNPNNESEIVEIFQSVNDKHEYIKDGIRWQRVWTVPNAAICTKIDPFSQSSFISATNNKKETIGSLQDRSKEASLKREEKVGIDPLKQKYYDNYSKIRRGELHPEIKKQKAVEKLKKMGVNIE